MHKLIGQYAGARLPPLMPTDSLEADRRYCREVLPRVSRTFALNIQLLDGSLGEAVRVGYLLCRAADALEDSWPGPAADIRARFERFLAALEGDAHAAQSLADGARALAAGRDDLELVAQLPRVLAVADALPGDHRAAVREGVRTLALGMSRYASRAAERGDQVPYLDSEAELEDYCWVVAGCVGVMLTQLLLVACELPHDDDHARRLALSPMVGQALQLTNILLDWPHDVRRGRCYLPASWLAEAGITMHELVGSPHKAIPPLRDRLERKARAALAQVPEYIERVPTRLWRYRLFCLWPALWSLGSLARTRQTPDFPWGPERPRMLRSEVMLDALAAVFTVHRGDSMRWHFRRRAAS